LSAINSLGNSTPATASVDTLAAPALATLSSAAISASAVTLNWTLPPGLKANQLPTSFAITRSGGAGTVSLTAPANATSFADTGLLQNTAYTYSVSAVNGSGATPVLGAPSTTAATTQFALPSTVTGFTATSIMASQVNLKWSGGTPAASYTITRKVGANGAVTTSPGVITANGSWTDTTTAAATSYTYTVTAVNGANLSNTATATVTTPVNMTAPTIGTLAATATQITVNWTDRSTNENRFAIERSDNGGAFALITTVATGSTTGTGGARSFVNTTTVPTGFGVVPGNVYTYRVTAQAPALPGATTNQSLPSATVAIDYSTALAPTGLTTTRVQRSTGATSATDRVDLSWTPTVAVANRPAVTGYTIEWSTTANFAAIAGTSTVTGATTAAVTNLSVARGAAAAPVPAAYYFRIRANNAVGNGVPSTPIVVNTL
jgi:fibronectin type 3 domain-containing protein